MQRIEVRLDNGRQYHIANVVAVTEYAITTYLNPALKNYSYISAIGWSGALAGLFGAIIQVGMVLVIFGQTLRSLAMIHASTNFSHVVAFRKREGHRLVSDGIYG